MLAVHWTPVSNTKSILKNGITKTKKGLYCFPLTGHKALDRWWIMFFNQCYVRERKRYNGIVFRLKQNDMPACFGHWIGSATKDYFQKPINDIKQLELEFRKTVLFRLGEELAYESDPKNYLNGNSDKLYSDLAENEIKRSPNALTEKMKSLDFMQYVFEDYQIVLSKSIKPDRILKILPQRNEFGRVLKRQKINRIINRSSKKYLAES